MFDISNKTELLFNSDVFILIRIIIDRKGFNSESYLEIQIQRCRIRNIFSDFIIYSNIFQAQRRSRYFIIKKIAHQRDCARYFFDKRCNII